MPKRISIATVAALKQGEMVYDSEVTGLIARRHKRGISYEVRRRGQHAIHVVIGNDTTLTPGAAKQKARKVLGEHDAAKPIEAGKRIMVEAGWKLYKEKRLDPLVAIGKRSPKTISTYENGLKRLSAKVRRMTLRQLSLDKDILIEEHKRIAATRAPAADGALRALSAVYHYIAREEDPTLPSQSPTRGVDLTIKEPINGAPTLNDEPLARGGPRCRRCAIRSGSKCICSCCSRAFDLSPCATCGGTIRCRSACGSGTSPARSKAADAVRSF